MTRIDWLAAFAGRRRPSRRHRAPGLTGFRPADRPAFRGTHVRDRRASPRPAAAAVRALGTSVPTGVLRRRSAGRTIRPRSPFVQVGDQIGIVAVRLALVALKHSRISLMRSMVARMSVTASLRRGQAVAEFAHQRFGGMRQRFQPRQAEETAGAFDGVDETENIAENLGVVRVLLKTHELDVDHVETFVGLGDKFPQQVVHRKRLHRRASARPAASRRKRGQCVVKRLILVAVLSYGVPVNRHKPAGNAPDGAYCAETTTVSPSIAMAALMPQAWASRPA